MATILIQNRQKILKVPVPPLRKVAQKIFKQLDLGKRELSILLCDDEIIAELNQKYLGREGPTNVLSFPMPDPPEGEEEAPLGDVVVNVERAVQDAKEGQVHPLSEVAYLLIHGICHLAGYDHEGDQAHRAKEMEEMEKDLHSKFSSILVDAAKE